jgi:hypothetical protein
VAHTTASNSDTHVLTTPAITTTGATLIVRIISDYETTADLALTDSVTGCTPTGSPSTCNTFTCLTKYSVSNSSAVMVCYVLAPTVGVNHVFHSAETSGSTAYQSETVMAFSGATSYDTGKLSGNSASGATTLAAGSLTPSASNSLIVAGISSSLAGGTFTIDSSFITDSGYQTAGGSGTNFGVSGSYLIQSGGPSAVNPTWTTGSGSLAATLAVFH